MTAGRPLEPAHHWPRSAALSAVATKVTPHPAALADDVDHDPPHLAMVSGDY
jgi:hypothetical protein